MKNNYKHLTLVALVLATGFTQAQTVSTFESINLNSDSIWNGGPNFNTNSIENGNALFENAFDTSFGGYWANGFAVSSKKNVLKDSVASGFSQLYTGIAGSGAEGSAQYAIAQNRSMVVLTGAAQGKQLDGVYVTNSNYAYLSMRWGDAFARAFNDSDFFLLTVFGYENGTIKNTTASFYLAKDGEIVTDWTWLDLKPLGNVDSIEFRLTSSDTGAFGMNTPAFFCLDNFTTRDVFTRVNEVLSKTTLKLYPNPTSSKATIEGLATGDLVSVIDITGKTIIEQTATTNLIELDIEMWNNGMYLVVVNGTTVNKLVKQ
ncbi:MAG: DUF4465 domain-containing protein [Bacteroidia bacterium]|jgi:hypothetical protein|nr:DUF4465 domain-containing protein [Bacteroidia bacterium]